MKKEHVLFLVTKSETGGAQKFVAEQIKVVADEFVLYVATNQKGWLTEEVKDVCADFFFNKKIESRLSFPYLAALISFIKKNSIHLIICNSANAGLYGRLAAYLTGRKSIYVSHGWSSVYNGGRVKVFLNAIEKLLALIGDSVLCVSRSDYQTARKEIKIADKKLKLIQTAIFPVTKANSIQNGESTKKIKILSVARFCYPKRQDLLVKAMLHIDQAELYLIGSGPQFNEVKLLSEQLQLNNTYFLGEIPGFDKFNDFDAFALISESEGLSISALEALSAGLPVMLSNVGGCPELVEDNGILVKNEEIAIQRGIELMCRNFYEYKKHARSFFDSNHNLFLKKELYLQYYKSILSGEKMQ